MSYARGFRFVEFWYGWKSTNLTHILHTVHSLLCFVMLLKKKYFTPILLGYLTVSRPIM